MRNNLFLDINRTIIVDEVLRRGTIDGEHIKRENLTIPRSGSCGMLTIKLTVSYLQNICKMTS